ncbi:hypothetical protein TcBrA4_0064440 [Trypanosoma cruzi]|nr:hypothetical protein TcBrA4_0064440 [Trypanosoma cruzi]
MRVKAYGMKEWIEEGEFDLEGIWTGFIWLRWPHARRMCFRIMGEGATGFSEVARQCNSGFVAARHSGLPAMAGDGPWWTGVFMLLLLEEA